MSVFDDASMSLRLAENVLLKCVRRDLLILHPNTCPAPIGTKPPAGQQPTMKVRRTIDQAATEVSSGTVREMSEQGLSICRHKHCVGLRQNHANPSGEE